MITRVLDIRAPRYRLIGALTGTFDADVSFEASLGNVSAHRRRKALAFRFEKDRRLSLLAGLLLDDLLQEHGLRERDMAYVENEHGKPALSAPVDWHFSLAHSHEMAVAALSSNPVGVDVEHLPSFAYDIADPSRWTIMEAVGKALGIGVGGYVDAAQFAVPDDFETEYLECGDYLVCVALQCG